MRRQQATETLEFHVGPHSAREGWAVARITYKPSNPEHKRQVSAAIAALVQARRDREAEQVVSLAAAGGA